MGSVLGTISLKTDPLFSRSHQLPTSSPQWKFMISSPNHAKSLIGLVLFRSCACNLSCCEFISTTVLPKNELLKQIVMKSTFRSMTLGMFLSLSNFPCAQWGLQHKGGLHLTVPSLMCSQLASQSSLLGMLRAENFHMSISEPIQVLLLAFYNL